MTVGSEADDGDLDGYSRRRWAALLVTLVAVLIDMVDSTVLNVALPSVQADLDATSTELEWAVAGYTLAFAAAMITGARLGDRFGRRRLYLTGLAGFVVTSTFAGLSVNSEMLIASRVFQGAAAAMMVPQVLAMLQVDFPRAEQPKAMSVYGMTFAVGGIGGPVLGGVLLEADLLGLDWRPIFFINVPLGIAAFVAAAFLTRESRGAQRESFDVPGSLIATLGLLLLLFPLVQGRELDWPWWVFVLMAASPPVLWLFVRYESRVKRRGGSPVIDPELFRHRGAVGGLLVAVLFFSGMAYQLVLTVHLQQSEGYSPLRTAVALATFTVGVGIGSAVAPKLMVLGRLVVLLGCTVITVGMALTAAAVDRYAGSLEWWHLAPGMVVAGLGLAMVAGTLMTIVLAKVPKSASGAASSMINTSIQVGVATGIAIVATVYFAMLEGGEPPTDAAIGGVLTVIGLYVLAALVALVLPGGRVSADDVPGADSHPQAAATDQPFAPEHGSADARTAATS